MDHFSWFLIYGMSILVCYVSIRRSLKMYGFKFSYSRKTTTYINTISCSDVTVIVYKQVSFLQ